MKNPSISSGDGAVFFRHYASRRGKLDEVQRVLDDHANPVDVNAVNCNLNTAVVVLRMNVGPSVEQERDRLKASIECSQHDRRVLIFFDSPLRPCPSL
jgi:hypothetical protein